MAELALVTGGDTGIGKAIADALAARGLRVVSASRRSGHDLTDPGAIERLVGSLARLDVLVNNAGLAESAPLGRTDDAMWDRHMALNATAPFRLCRAALPLLEQAPRGRIINMASTAATEGAPYIAAYAASKHALLGLTRVLQAELKKVRVHAVCPGFVDTPLTDRTVANIVQVTGMPEEDARAALAKQNRSGALIQPAQVAEAVVDLLDADENRVVALD